MSQPLTITECLLDQCRRYPALEPQDLIKALHQSVYGCGHLVGAAEEGVGRIREEMESARGDAAGAEMLAGAYCRLPLAWARKLGMKAETVFALFAYSARTPSGTAEELGKPTGSDRVNEKSTFVTALGLEESHALVHRLTDQAEAALEGFDQPEFLIQLAQSLAQRRK